MIKCQARAQAGNFVYNDVSSDSDDEEQSSIHDQKKRQELSSQDEAEASADIESVVEESSKYLTSS